MIKTFCPECGPNVKIDEDGCCVNCGNGANGNGLDYLNKMHRCIGLLNSMVMGGEDHSELSKNVVSEVLEALRR